MAENLQRNKGRPGAYTLDRGGAPAESGPFIGEVVNNTDPTRSGRIQVWIEDFGGDKTDKTMWRTVSYISPFFGATGQTGTSKGTGTYVGNKQSYGMWAAAPDVGTSVICFFASGDPNQGYYLGSVIQPGANHMVPAIGATKNFKNDNKAQDTYFKGATQLPTGEINVEDQAIDANPRYFDQKKPVHGVTAGVMLQQGTITDPVRGPTTFNAQRETPSAVMGISSPGRPVFEGGYDGKTFQKKLEKNEVTPEQGKMISRQGGHSIVLDDGEMNGNTQQIRLRSAKGHQITMSDDGDTLFITHANGQTYVELGKEGTVDIYSTNSVNIRSQGDINFHADRNINMQGKSVVIAGTESVSAQGKTIVLNSQGALSLAAQATIGIKSTGAIALDCASKGTWKAGAAINLSAASVTMNGPAAPAVADVAPVPVVAAADVKFKSDAGFEKKSEPTTTVTSRTPTHQPMPGANKGVALSTSLSDSTPATPSPAVATKLADVTAMAAAKPPITVGDFAKMAGAAPAAIGSLTPQTLQGMMAQTVKDVGQPFDQISNTLGVGQFGFNAQQLEAAGLLKPGTYAAYLSTGQNTLESVLKSSSVWTGKDGATSLTSFLSDANMQNLTQTKLFESSFQNLKANGLIQGSETANVLGPLVNTTSQFGLGSVKQWLSQGSSVAGQATSVASGLSSGSVAGITGALAGGAALASAAGGLASGAFNSVSKMDLSMDSITTGADKALTQGVDQIKNLGTSAADQAKTMVTGAVAQANQVATGVVNQAEALANQVKALPDAAVTAMNNAAKAGQQAVDMVQTKLSDLVKGFSSMGAAAEKTVNRAQVDAAVKAVIGNEKVPTPTYTDAFSFSGLAELGNKAVAAVNDLQQQATTALASAKDILPKLPTNIG